MNYDKRLKKSKKKLRDKYSKKYKERTGNKTLRSWQFSEEYKKLRKSNMRSENRYRKIKIEDGFNSVESFNKLTKKSKSLRKGLPVFVFDIESAMSDVNKFYGKDKYYIYTTYHENKGFGYKNLEFILELATQLDDDRDESATVEVSLDVVRYKGFKDEKDYNVAYFMFNETKV